MQQDKSVVQQIEVAEVDLRRLGLLAKNASLPRHHAPEHGVFADDGVSAWKYAPEQRAGSSALIADLRVHQRPVSQPGLLWVWAQSRMLRPQEGGVEAVRQVWEFEALGWTMYSHEQGRVLKLGGPDGLLAVFTVAMSGSTDSEHSRQKSAAVLRAKMQQVAHGVWLGGFPPVGYVRWAATISESADPATGRREVVKWVAELPDGQWNGYPRTVTLLRPNEQAQQVRDIFTLMAEGDNGNAVSINEVMRRLAFNGLGDVRGPVDWSRTSLHALLVNEVYVGIQRDATGDPRPALWEPLVSAPVWDQVQRRLAANARDRRGVRSSFVLSGLLVCGVCQSRMGGECQVTPAGAEMMYYRRTSFRRMDDSERCAECRARVRAEPLEAAVREIVESLADHAVVRDAVAAEQAARAAGHTSTSARRNALEREMTEVERSIDNLVPLLEAGGATAERLGGRVADLDAQAARLREQLRSMQGGHFPAHTLVSNVASFATVYAAATFSERKEMLRAFVHRVEVFATRGSVRVAIRRPAGVS